MAQLAVGKALAGTIVQRHVGRQVPAAVTLAWDLLQSVALGLQVPLGWVLGGDRLAALHRHREARTRRRVTR